MFITLELTFTKYYNKLAVKYQENRSVNCDSDSRGKNFEISQTKEIISISYLIKRFWSNRKSLIIIWDEILKTTVICANFAYNKPPLFFYFFMGTRLCRNRHTFDYMSRSFSNPWTNSRSNLRIVFLSFCSARPFRSMIMLVYSTNDIKAKYCLW